MKSLKTLYPFFTSILWSCCSLTAIPTANGLGDPIYVEVSTENSLFPLYLTPMVYEKAMLDTAYLKQLENVIAFDLNHNGFTSLIKNTPAGAENGFDSFGDIGKLTQQGILYIVKTQVVGKELQLRALIAKEKLMKSASPITLTGDLAQDRRAIHGMMDALNKTLFEVDGIASTKIIYSVKEKTPPSHLTGISEIWEADYDGANAHPLTKVRSFSVMPAAIPPKSGFTSGGFLYTSYRNGQAKIYAATYKDGVGKRVIQLKGNQLMPAISLQRDKIAFISDVMGNPDLFLQPFTPEGGAVGKPFQIFSAKQATQSSPTFSPDGKRIAFVSDKDGAPRVYVIDIPAPGVSLIQIKPTLLTKVNRESSAPSWSPDGKMIAYCSRTGGERQIWVYDYNTHAEKQVTFGPGNKENPSWAPNSLHLVYNASDKNGCDLFITHINGGDPIRITEGLGEKRFPNWIPK